MIGYTLVHLDGRLYRYSTERRISGCPCQIEYQGSRDQWRRVRNQDRIDQIWKIADRPVDYLGSMLTGSMDMPYCTGERE